MEGLLGRVFSFSSSSVVLPPPPYVDVFLFSSLHKINRPSKYNLLGFRVYRKNLRLNKKISCRVPEIEIEENPTSKGVTPTGSFSKSRMEEYNIAMKRMMRNPYEYHHDLGYFPA